MTTIAGPFVIEVWNHHYRAAAMVCIIDAPMTATQPGVGTAPWRCVSFVEVSEWFDRASTGGQGLTRRRSCHNRG